MRKRDSDSNSSAMEENAASMEDRLIRRNIAYYQAASYNYSHNLLKWQAPMTMLAKSQTQKDSQDKYRSSQPRRKL